MPDYHLVVSKETHKRVHQIKLDKDLPNADSVIQLLFKKAGDLSDGEENQKPEPATLIHPA